jgi:hypothetical protein
VAPLSAVRLERRRARSADLAGEPPAAGPCQRPWPGSTPPIVIAPSVRVVYCRTRFPRSRRPPGIASTADREEGWFGSRVSQGRARPT